MNIMNMDKVFLLSVLCINLLLFAILIFGMYLLYTELQKKRKLEEFKFNMGIKLSEDDFYILDKMITDNFQLYRVMNLEYVDNLYINEKMQNEIFEYVVRKTISQISPTILTKLKFIYNEDALGDIVAEKTNILIMDYTIEVNGNYSGSK